MRFFTITSLLAALLLSVLAVIPFLPAAKLRANTFLFEARVTSSVAGAFRVYYDDGSGFREEHAEGAPLQAGVPHDLQIPIPPSTLRGVRIDPINAPGTVILSSLRIVSRAGWTVADLPVAHLRPFQDIASLTLRDGELHLTTTPASEDPQLTFNFIPELVIGAGWRDYVRDLWRYALPLFAGLALLLFLLDRAPLTRAALRIRLAALLARPHRAIAALAAAAVIASAYPVVFLGQSFVSPNFGTSLLYDQFPTLPGHKSGETIDAKMSDVGAIMWQHVPFSMIQHRAAAAGDLPLWNRYNAAGVPLLAQGQSMFGDPLHLFVVAANGASWAWDLKYLLAKWLFATGLACLVLALLVGTNPQSEIRNPQLAAALLVALVAPFIGFFVYRLNHPAFFSLCYAPWPLYCLVRIAQSTTPRALAAWCAGLFIANLALMNSGTVKEAYMLLVCVNFSGACILLALNWPGSASASVSQLSTLNPQLVRLPQLYRKLAAVAWTALLFVLFTLPIWFTFLQTLQTAYTGYNSVNAYQIQPTLLLGFFDEIFYRVVMPHDNVFNPSLNFVLLFGFLYFLVTLRLQFSRRAAIALALSSLLPLSLAFGLVSPTWIVRIPFLANVAHLDNTFSCALIVLWSVLAGLGFATALQRLGTREGRHDLILAGLLFLAAVFAWVAFGHAAHRPIFGPTFTVNPPGQVLTFNVFITRHLFVVSAALIALAILLQRAFARRRLTPAPGLLLLTCLLVLLWRYGQHPTSVGFEDFTVRPPARADFTARSEAMDFTRAAHAREPGRGYGIRGNFFPGWTGVYGLETIHGPDALVNPWLRELAGVSGVERIWDWRLYTDGPSDALGARRFFDALNVRFYFDLKSNHPDLAKHLKLVHRSDLDVYESPTAWPRAFFTPQLHVYDEPAELVQKIRASNGALFAAAQRSDPTTAPALARFAIPATDPASPNPQSAIRKPQFAPPAPAIPATDYRLTENATSFRIRATAPGVIVLSEAFWPGDCRAELNGRRVPVLRVNHAFRGIVVDAPGDYAVNFFYWPRHFTRNLWLSAAAAALAAISLALAFLLTRSRSPRNAPPPPADAAVAA